MTYFFGLVNRGKDQAVYNFFMVQYSRRSSTDWVCTVLKDFEDVKMDSSFQFLESITPYQFKRILKEKIKRYAFDKLIKEKITKSKLRHITYNELKLQNYLFDRETTVDEKIETFKWRTSMAKHFGENFRGGRQSVLCSLCSQHLDSQEETFNSCESLQETLVEGNYHDLFLQNIPKKTIKTISRISRMRK